MKAQTPLGSPQHHPGTTRDAVPGTRTMLLLGAVAGPIYVAVGTAEAVVRKGFDIRIHSLSLLANGPGGWVHSAMLVITGLLTVVGALGLGRVGFRPRTSVVGLVVFGLGVAGAGLLTADPMAGFPAGTPAGPPATVTASGVGHLVSGGIGFLGLIVSCLAAGVSAARSGRRGWAVLSLVTGIYYLASFAGIASGGGNTVINLAFTGAVLLGWVWITLLMLRSRQRSS